MREDLGLTVGGDLSGGRDARYPPERETMTAS
jgi:hypothetical protein